MDRLLIFPFNGNGLEALDCIGINYEFIGFIDDTIEKQGENPMGFKVYGRDSLFNFPDAKVLAVPGSPKSYSIRHELIESLQIPKDRFATVIHPKAQISKLACIGYNTLIMAGCVITSNTLIGNHICILPNSVIHHDSIIEDFSLIGSNVTIAGHTVIRKNCYIGSGSSVINSIEIGKNTLVGMGTNVIRSIPENSKSVGNPARVLETFSK